MLYVSVGLILFIVAIALAWAGDPQASDRRRARRMPELGGKWRRYEWDDEK